jgi:hypothetical protein
MAFSEADRVWIRHFMGFAAIFVQADLRLENSIQAIQSQADGGVRPDSSSENYVKGCVYGVAAVTGQSTGVTPGGLTQNLVFASPAQRGLITIEATIAQQDAFLGALSADGGEVKIDSARETARLRWEGRRLVTAMATMLATSPRRDVFSTTPANPSGDPFYANPDQLGSRYQW